MDPHRVLCQGALDVDQPPLRLIAHNKGNLCLTAVSSSIAFCQNEPSPCRQRCGSDRGRRQRLCAAR
jgi:hypothetical protein